MEKLLILFIFFMLNNFSKGQYFEGKIIYSVSYRDSKTYKTDTSLSFGLGNQETFYIKGGNYLIKGNGSLKEWVLYRSSTNKIYEKYKNNDTLYITDAGINNNEIKYKYHYKNVTTKISESDRTGKKERTNLHDREWVFITDKGEEYFYYYKRYSVNSKLFARHNYEHFGYFLSLANRLPYLRNYNVGQFNCEKWADDFFEERIDDSLFEVPNNLILKEK